MGGGLDLALDAGEPPELVELLTPEHIFQARWEQIAKLRARKALQAEYVRRERAERYDALHPFLERHPEPGEYGAIGARLDIDEGSVASAVGRMRQRYGDLVRFEVYDTCRPDAFAEEWAELDWQLLT